MIGIVNGIVRRAAYEQPLGNLAAHRLSNVTAIGQFGADTYLLDRRWPIATRDAALIGTGWLGVTAAFELGFGRHVAGTPWTTLLRDYDLAEGCVVDTVVATVLPWSRPDDPGRDVLDGFPLARARAELVTVSAPAHPMGSTANIAIRDFLAPELQATGLDPQVQSTRVTMQPEAADPAAHNAQNGEPLANTQFLEAGAGW